MTPRERVVLWGALVLMSVVISFLGVGIAHLMGFEAGGSLGVLAALVPVATVVGAIVSWQAHAWNQRRATLDIACRWNDGEVAKARREVLQHFPLPWTAPLDIVELDRRFEAHREQHLRDNLLILLNHLDIVAMGVEEDIYHPRMTEHLYGFLLTRHYRHFHALIRAQHALSPAPDDPTLTVWWYLVRVGDRWTTRREAPTKHQVTTAVSSMNTGKA